ncbi:MAG: thiamine phosphate synthase [Variibacter sp.]
MTLSDPPLLLVIDRSQARTPLPDILAAAFAAGCRWASIREKDLAHDDLLALRDALIPVAAKWNAALTIHAADPALAADLAGLHLPAGGDVEAARAALGRNKLLGLSVHGAGEAAAANPFLVDYIVAGPAFLTKSKPGYGPALGLDGLRAIAAATSLPVIGIGGVTSDNVATLRAAGVAGIAVMGGVMRAHDPGAEVQALIAAWGTAV